MRIKSWLWILVLAFFIGSVPVFAIDRDQDRGERSRDGREDISRGDRSSENYQSEREWREYLKARNKSYKEWAKANREEQRDFDKYLRERAKDSRGENREYRDRGREGERDRWEDQRERDKEWREYLRARNREYRDYSRSSRQELDDFYDYLRGRGYRYGDQFGWSSGIGSGRAPRNGACFYTDANYGGESFCLNSGDRRPSVGDHFNDRFSSIRIFGRARVTIFKDRDFSGSRRTYTNDAPHLGDFNDEITSIEVR
jgi:hypothetical protein